MLHTQYSSKNSIKMPWMQLLLLRMQNYVAFIQNMTEPEF